MTLMGYHGASVLPQDGVFGAVLVSAFALAVFRMIWCSVTVTGRRPTGGALVVLRNVLKLRPASRQRTYRERAAGEEIAVGRRRFLKRDIREVVIGAYRKVTPGEIQSDFWGLYLVLKDTVIELDVFRERNDARDAAYEVAELLDVPVRERTTGSFGTEQDAGRNRVTDGLAQLAAFAGLMTLAALGVAEAVLAVVPVLVLIDLLLQRELARRTQPAFDDAVATALSLHGPSVRVVDEVVVEEALELDLEEMQS
ncbi:MAG: hypothetical protein AAGE52_42600 [Myxococcota bacterium]